MKRFKFDLGMGGLGLVIGLLSVQLLHTHAKNEASKNNPAPKLQIQDAPLQREGRLTTSFAPAIKKAAPSVVNIFTTKNIKESQDPRLSPFFNDPMFRRFFGGGDEEEDESDNPRRGRRPRSRQEQSLGSGVIVTEDGYIVTNNHVVEGADEVKVVLASGQEYTAKVIGNDPPTDSAVIKIDGKGLPAVTIANSDELQVGDIVLAIGNPFGIGQTVTMGIISATGRGELGIADYEDWIQTDASINPGNSGGALIDAEGRLVGINSAILSRTGGNQGVGFAVPINMARGIMERLIKDGKVVRGYLGVGIQPVTAELSKEFGLKDQSGALVGGVNDNTPAAEAGIKPGDVITEFNGKKVSDNRHLRLMVSQTAPNTAVPVKVVREGKPMSFNVKLAELPTEDLPMLGKRGPSGKQAPPDDTLDGVEVADLDAKTRRQFNVPNEVKGALVTNVEQDSTSFEAGLRPGDVIMEMNRKIVANAEQAVELSDKVKGPRVLLRVWSRGGSRYMFVDTHKKGNRGK